ncbi:hypothetical protein Slin14017_G114590 [Septoria linicola]|nr:hypothetical protein Slin14017_G114590 [Septoria linicola]
MSSVAPVTRGEFHYRDVLLVDVGGELKRHARASEAELRALLKGAATKDQVGHWWEAQLIHYGLHRSKQKDTAKVRLQQALSQGRLKSQPPHLADMESQMKKEYAAAVRKAMRTTAGEINPSKSGGTKRVREEESAPSSKKTKISIRVGDVAIDIDQTHESKQRKPVKAAAESRKIATPKPSGTTRRLPNPASSSPFSSENVFQKSAPTPRATARSVSVKKEPSSKQSAQLANSPPPSSATHKGYLFDADAMDTRADMSRDKLSITGVYTIECPQITELLPEKQDSLRLVMCVDNESGITWGGFELAMKSGVIKMDELDFNRNLTFGWRARDSWENTLRFGQKCFGNIEFDGAGRLYGMFYSMFNEPCEFTGRRRPGPLWSGKSAYKYKQEWDAFPKEAYGR